MNNDRLFRKAWAKRDEILSYWNYTNQAQWDMLSRIGWICWHKIIHKGWAIRDKGEIK